MKKYLLCAILIIIAKESKEQQCLSGGCVITGNEYPNVGAPYTPPSNWQVLINPKNGNPALMNGGNYTRFNVVQGNTYEWTYCEQHGGVSTSWDAQLTLSNDANPSAPICFSTDFCGTNGNAPYIKWTANFTGVARILTTAYSSGAGCKTNTGTYNRLAYKQTPAIIIDCITPGTPLNLVATQTGQTSANFSWSSGNPQGSSTVTYYWAVSTSPSVTYDNATIKGITTNTYTSTSALSCGTTYYLRVFAKTNCNETSSNYATSASFTTGNCPPTGIYGIDVSHWQGTIDWQQVHTIGKKVFAYAKCSEGVSGADDATFTTNMINGTNAGVVMGAYHLARPDNNSAIDEATHFLSIANKNGYIGQNRLPPALDLEPVFVDGLSKSDLSIWVQTWMTKVQSITGVVPIIYTTRGEIQNRLNSSLTIYKLWIANYNKTGPSDPASPQTGIGDWSWVFNQYAGGDYPQPVSGISGGVDLDIFNGDITAFNKLISVSLTKPDLKITENTQSVSSTTIEAGSNFTAYASENNAGDGTAGANEVSLWLSPTEPLNTNNAVYLGAITGFPSLSPKTNSAVLNSSINMPSTTAAGNYYLYFWADGKGCGTSSSCTTCNGDVTESDECNNFVSIPITVTASEKYADLVILDPQISPSSVLAGGKITATCYVKNQGQADAATNYIALWLSADQQFDHFPTDLNLNANIIVPPLAAGQTSEKLTITFNTPSLPDASSLYHYIMFGVDATEIIPEGNNEGNNQEFVPISFIECSTPAKPIITGNNDICLGQSTILQIDACADCSYKWSDGTESAINTVQPSSTTFYTVTVTNQCNNTATSDAYLVTVNTTPDKPSIVNGQSQVVVGSGVFYDYSTNVVADAEGYKWKSANNYFNPIKTTEPYVSVTWQSSGTSTDMVCVQAYKAECYSDYTCTGSIILPLTIKSFSASKQAKGNLLEWVTLTEINVKRFDIERSSDGINYNSIGYIDAKGNLSTVSSSYSFIDGTPVNGINYYRLHVWDKDGKAMYSEVRTINNFKPFTAQIIPNPVSNNKLNLTINSGDEIQVQLSIINTHGKTLKTEKLFISPGISTKQINLPAMANGIYYLKIISTKGQTSLKFVKGD